MRAQALAQRERAFTLSQEAGRAKTDLARARSWLTYVHRHAGRRR